MSDVPAGYVAVPPPSSLGTGPPPGYVAVPPPKKLLARPEAPTGFFKRFAQSFGLPTSKAELEATAEAIRPYVPYGPAGLLIPIVKGTVESAKRGAKEGYKEVKEAAQNIAEGGPVLSNLAKGTYGGVHAGLQALTPIGGPQLEQAGIDWHAKNYWGAAGGMTGLSLQALLASGSKPTIPETTIKGVKFPETLGQAAMQPGGLTQTLEHYTSGTFLGKELKQVAVGQQESARQVMANLAGQPGTPEMLAGNYGKAAKATREAATPLYESLAETPTPRAADVAQAILADPDVQPLLNATTRRALGGLGETANPTIQGTAKSLGYKNTAEWIARRGLDEVKRYLPADLQAEIAGQNVTARNALKARSELADLAYHMKDRADKRLLRSSLSDLDNAINSHFTPEELAIRQRADTLTRRAYVMDKVEKSLVGIERGQTPGRAPAVLTQRFNGMVNNLVKSGDLNVLFPEAADRNAMIQLAQFLNEKAATLKGQVGVSEGIARVGVALEAARIPAQVVTGAGKSAAHGLTYLAGYKFLVGIMAHPSGAIEVLDLLRQASVVGPVVARPVSRQAQTEIMLKAKTGEIPPGEADRRIRKMGGSTKLVRPAAPPP